MTGYQKLKDQIEDLKKQKQFHSERATAYFFALMEYIPEDKKKDAGELIEQMLNNNPEQFKGIAHLDPAVMMLTKKYENR